MNVAVPAELRTPDAVCEPPSTPPADDVTVTVSSAPETVLLKESVIRTTGC